LQAHFTLSRIANGFDHFNISNADQRFGKSVAEVAFGPSASMMHQEDPYAPAAALLHLRPAMTFEIGTYLGASSDFFLNLLPETKVISIAFVSPEPAKRNRRFNNTVLGPDKIGSLVSGKNLERFTQLIGDQHAIQADEFVKTRGRMGFVSIDGDHSRISVGQNTELAQEIIAPDGAIGWHDANPKRRYIGSRQFLEGILPCKPSQPPTHSSAVLRFGPKRLRRN
jgi:Methyltransferase domain